MSAAKNKTPKWLKEKMTPFQILRILGKLSKNGTVFQDLDEISKKMGMSGYALVQMAYRILNTDADLGVLDNDFKLIFDSNRDSKGKGKTQVRLSNADLVKGVAQLAGMGKGEVSVVVSSLDSHAGLGRRGNQMRALAARLRTAASIKPGDPVSTFLGNHLSLNPFVHNNLRKVNTAIKGSRVLSFHYKGKRRSRLVARRVKPIDLYLHNKKYYLLGLEFNGEGYDEKSFIVEEILRLKVGGKIAKPADYDPTGAVNRRVSGFNPEMQGGKQVRLLARGEAAKLLAGGMLLARPDSSRGSSTLALPGKRSDWKRFEIFPTHSNYVTQLLPLIPDVTVEEPSEFRQVWEAALTRLKAAHHA